MRLRQDLSEHLEAKVTILVISPNLTPKIDALRLVVLMPDSGSIRNYSI